MALSGRYYGNPLEMVDKASRRLREVMDGLDSSLFIGMLTVDGMVTYISRSALESAGLQLKDVLGQPFENTVWWAYSDSSKQQLRHAIEQAANGVPARFDHVMQTHDGHIRIMDFSLNPVFDQSGRVAYLVPSSHDITERKTAEQALRLTQFAVDHAPDAMFQIDSDGVIRAVNHSACRLLGYDVQSLTGQPIYMIDQRQSPQAWVTLWRQLKVQGVQRFESVYRHRDGSSITVEVSASYITYEQEQFSFIYVSDIRERKAAELELAQLNRALRLLSACNYTLIHAQDEMTLLHDICQLMVSVGGGYRMAWVGYAEQDEHKTIKPMAHAGEERGYLAEARLSWSEHEPQGQGPGGRCIRTGQAVICEDVSNAMALHWRKQAYANGYRGIICLPLRDREHVFGMLGLYSASTLVGVSADEMALLQELADNLSFGISNLRVQQERQRLLEHYLQHS